jgi:plastocyanin
MPRGAVQMKKLLILLAGMLAIAGATPAVSQSEPTATHVHVSITSTGFQPESVVIQPNDTVRWTNNDRQPHQIVSDTNAFPKSRVLDPGESYSFRFVTPSSYTYHDGRRRSSTGAVHVRGARVTIGLSRRYLVYGNPVEVGGTIPTGQSGELVTVTITRYGGQTQTRQVITDGDGVWSFVDRPPIRSGYRAEWQDNLSVRAPFVNVRPLVIFRILSARANRFHVRVAAQRPYGGKTVFLQRRTTTRRWMGMRRIRLNARGVRRFTGRFPRGRTHARIWVARAPGYIAGFSVIQAVRR